MTIQDQVNVLIDDARAAADSTTLTAQNHANLAIAAAQSGDDADEPQKFEDRKPIPTLVFERPVEWKDIIDQDENAFRQEIIDQLTLEFDEFMQEWFPVILADGTTSWLSNAIDNGGTGIAPSVENAIWARARDREEIQRDGELASVTSRFARAGWVVPPGALTKQIATVRDNNAAQIGSVARDTAIKAADQEQNNVQFAVGASIQLQSAVFSAAVPFMGNLTAAYDPSNTKAVNLGNAVKDFYAAVNDYDRVRIAHEEIGIDWAKIGHSEDMSFQTLNTDVGLRRASTTANAALSTANSMGQIAAAALSSQNTVASLDSSELAEL